MIRPATAERQNDSRDIGPRPGRYRKVYPRIWVHRAFRTLDHAAKNIALYLLTGPQTNRIGLFRFSPGAAAEDLEMSSATFQMGLRAVLEAFGWSFDAENRVLWIPSHWSFNSPEGPNQLKGALADLAEVPSSPLKDRFCHHTSTLATETLQETFTETIGQMFPETFQGTITQTFPEPLPKGTPIQDQDQDQDQEQAGRAPRQSSNPSRQDPSPKPGRTADPVAGQRPDHAGHAYCAATVACCVPAPVHKKFASALTHRFRGDSEAASRALLGWYPTVAASLAADFVMPDAFKFWQTHFDERFATKADPPAAGNGSTRTFRCRHSPKCATEVACTLRQNAEYAAPEPTPFTGKPS